MTIFGKRYISEKKLKAILMEEYDFYSACRRDCFEKAKTSDDYDERWVCSKRADECSKLMHCVATIASRVEIALS